MDDCFVSKECSLTVWIVHTLDQMKGSKMTTLNVDFNDVPDEYAQVAPGLYDFEIDGAPELKGSKKDESNLVMHIKLKVVSEGEFQGMVIMDWLCTWTDMGKVDIKKFIRSALGDVPNGGIDMADLDGKIVKAVIKSEMYDDPATGEQKERRSVKEYVVG